MAALGFSPLCSITFFEMPLLISSRLRRAHTWPGRFVWRRFPEISFETKALGSEFIRLAATVDAVLEDGNNDGTAAFKEYEVVVLLEDVCWPSFAFFSSLRPNSHGLETPGLLVANVDRCWGVRFESQFAWLFSATVSRETTANSRAMFLRYFCCWSGAEYRSWLGGKQSCATSSNNARSGLPDMWLMQSLDVSISSKATRSPSKVCCGCFPNLAIALSTFTSNRDLNFLVSP
mmetsp:Transcript_39157/g.62731  ORF Transcript_39157/g.62731 Transcript_39157/m.62731 type:complete len:233 (-) Transcript_39157:120-818(-)